jgi:glutamyl-tRNA synthetase
MDKNIANKIFGNTIDIVELENKYPKRDILLDNPVTRFAPSPTGYMHIGGLFAALISERFAHQNNGIFYLRIEDTDKKREIEGAIKIIVDSLCKYNIPVDEGIIKSGQEKGEYGPYKQSERLYIYQSFAKYLVEHGHAYLCFCSSEELEDMAKKQEQEKIRPGYRGEWAIWRNKNSEDISKMINEGKPYVIRLKASGNFDNKIKFSDIVKGGIELSENDLDVVLIKSDGYPTYHFAHIIDDHLMRTTHVIRGDEWLSSVPLHLELWKLFNWDIPQYGHISPILKQDGDSKRKLSKRKDPEANVLFYDEKGYPVEAVIEYLFNLANSNFEEWKKQNPDLKYDNFKFSLSKLNKSGALFDENKLSSVSKEVIAKMSFDEKYNNIVEWLSKYDEIFLGVLNKNLEYTKKILSIENQNNVRKDFARWSDIKKEISYFFDEYFTPNNELVDMMNKEVIAEDSKKIFKMFLETYDESDPSNQWFAKIKKIASTLGYAENMKDQKNNPDKFKGNVSNVAQVIRIAVTGRTRTPDLWAIMCVLGKNSVIERIKKVEAIL